VPYRLSPQAEGDLERLYREGFDRFGEKQADYYALDLIKVFELLGENPRMARLRYEIDPPVRIHPHGSHMIVYEEVDDQVVILRIRHARENWAERPL
jgi:toxin ParE1/3/4